MHTLEELAKLTNSSFKGDKSIELHTVAPLNEATHGQISFVSNPKYASQLKNTAASAVILKQALAEDYAGNVLINDNPYLTFAEVLQILYAEDNPIPSVHKSVVIDADVIIHETASINANVVIEKGVTIAENVVIDAGCFVGRNSKLDKGVHLYPNVTLYKETQVGENTIIHSGAVIGADGFGFAPQPNKSWFKILQVGNVVIGKEVELGAGVTIDRAALGTTTIANGVKLDNQVHVGHNVKIDEHTAIAAGTVVGGSSSIGKRCQIGGAVAISGHLNVVDDVIITGKSMVIKSINTAGVYSSGIATDENKKWRKNAARFRSLDEIAKKVKDLEKQLNGK